MIGLLNELRCLASMLLTAIDPICIRKRDLDRIYFIICIKAGPCSAVGNVSGYRCVSDCRSRGREFDPGRVPYFRGD